VFVIRSPFVSFGFRFLLVHPDGEPADPPAFLTAIPSWKPGDEFPGGSALRKFRIVAIDEPPSDEFSGLFTVETVDE
jgi:hypothetical protein